MRVFPPDVSFSSAKVARKFLVMSADNQPNLTASVEPIFGSPETTPVSDELRKLTAMLAPLCPRDSKISFEFNGKLRLHVDVRRFEEMTTMESLLPIIAGGIFSEVQRGNAEKHSFFHRVSAVVAR
jgi:hypothetical protein